LAFAVRGSIGNNGDNYPCPWALCRSILGSLDSLLKWPRRVGACPRLEAKGKTEEPQRGKEVMPIEANESNQSKA